MPNEKNHQFILYHKPVGVTSFQALSPLKRVWGKRLGHTGTLDQFAHGLLGVLTGNLTKLVPLLTGLDKIYEAVVEFGRQTDTLDPDGVVISHGRVPGFEELQESLLKFQGDLWQTPPEYSAVHVNGKRASQLARSGASVALAPRKIQIFELQLLDWTPPFAKIRVHCSKGTYIRALARDWALSMGTFGMLTSLFRQQVGPFLCPEHQEILTPRQLFQSLNIPVYTTEQPEQARFGRPPGLWGNWDPVPQVAIMDKDDNLVAVLKWEGDWQYHFVCA